MKIIFFSLCKLITRQMAAISTTTTTTTMMMMMTTITKTTTTTTIHLPYLFCISDINGWIVVFFHLIPILYASPTYFFSFLLDQYATTLKNER